jgi:hypothetical protein
MSPTQLEKIEDHVMRNLDRFRASDQFRSIEADIEMFGLGSVPNHGSVILCSLE